MAAWEGGNSLVNYAYPQCPKSLQWMFAGSMAGATTTIIGDLYSCTFEYYQWGFNTTVKLHPVLCRQPFRAFHGVGTYSEDRVP